MCTDNEDKLLYRELTYKLIGLAMQVHKTLGHGFLEKVYENAMMVLLRKESLEATQQANISVFFEGEAIGNYCADILVENKVILEPKAAESITDAHRAQTLNYLKATGLKVALILNFGKTRLEHERLAW